METLKEVNQIIQKAARLRIGRSKSTVISECRNSIKTNNIHQLVKVIKTGNLTQMVKLDLPYLKTLKDIEDEHQLDDISMIYGKVS